MECLENLIKNIIFIKDGGIPLLSVVDSEDQLYLISGYLEAIKSFSREFDNVGDIRSISLSNLTFSYFCKNPEFYIILIHDSKIPMNLLTDFLDDINALFLSEYNEDEIKNWNGDTNLFQPFVPKLLHKIELFSQKCSIHSESYANLLETTARAIFKNKEILAISSISISGRNMKNYINENLDDFEIQVFIGSPYYKRTLLNLIPMLNAISNIMLGNENSYYIAKTEKFYLGMKQKESEYLGILGSDKDVVINAIHSL
ncbi:MAG: hypothetical protein ACTSO9_01440 [Candidatus Helarchaeota archaeon]